MTQQPTPPADVWAAIDDLWTWLEDRRTHDGDTGLVLRMLKLTEEVGEVAQAVIGATGQNPRKGVSHTWDDVRGELCDVVITALVALRSLTPDPREVFERHLAGVTARSLGPSADGGLPERPASRPADPAP
ncbi:MazG-like family protein [Streptomyces sp. NPDC101237]|uniref:MazG-like family protein n=1 Tax=Streptomyces sp. NPDC101237 TaxID=3366139 RepID=UPI0037FEA664